MAIEIDARIILAAGHGGGDSGATGQGTTEAAECIQIVNRTADKLRADGRFDVVVIPHELNLVDEINWLNARYDSLDDGLAIEVHKNATVNGHGIESWFYSGDGQSQAIAQDVLDGIMSVPGMPPSRGVKGDATNRWGSLGWIRETNTWAILLEMGFVSDGGDPVDDSADNRYAEGIYQGILNFYGYPAKSAAPAPTPTPSPTPTPAPASQPKYRVYGADGKQMGAYNTEDGAWNKYASGGAKIVEVASGNDVTGAFVNKYRPTVPTPVEPQPNPHPEYDPAKDAQQDADISALKAAVQKITDFLASLFSGFKK